MKKALFLLVALLLTNIYITSAQNGILKGKVVDGKTSETLPGATISIDGTTYATATDFDGNFILKNLPPGKYSVSCNYISYSKKTITGVTIMAGQITNVDFLLETGENQMNTVVIEVEAKKESNVALTLMQKNNIRVADGITAETIRKTPDRSSSDVLKRVSGTTIQDNKFAIIRGLADRYNMAFINGSPLPSSESDRKAFSFDIFPANLLDNITIVKTGTPDLPGEFAGGIIQINTRSIPDENSMSLSSSVGYNTLTTGKKFRTYQGGKRDWIGLDDGSRALSDSIPATEIFRSLKPVDMANLAKHMQSDWALQSIKASPNYNFQYTLGRSGKIFKQEAGSFFALTYNNTSTTTPITRQDFEEQSGDTGKVRSLLLNDTTYNNNILAGVLWNMGYKIGSHSQFSFKNMVNINSNNLVMERLGERNDGNYEKGSLRWFTQNVLNSHQLSGEHKIWKLKFNWNGGYSNIVRNTPNMRRMIYTKPIPSSQNDTLALKAPWAASIATSGPGPSHAGNIFYSTNKETIYSAATDLSLPLWFMPEKLKTEIKAGIYYQERQRAFSSRNFGYSKYFNNYKLNKIVFKDSLLLLPEDSIFALENMGQLSPFQPATSTTPKKNGVGGFKLEETTKLNDAYSARAQLKATYLMIDNKFWEKFRLIWGTRIESYYQQLLSFEDDGDTIDTAFTVIDYLPSANFIFSPNTHFNFRLSYYKTLSRPEFRELAPFGFFNYNTFFTERGNPLLQRAVINNYDFRAEYYPGGGQIITASFFYKHFTNAIESVNRADVPRELTYQNVPEVNAYGVELEYRVNLGQLLNRTEKRILNNLNTFTNVSLIKSVVDVSNVAGAINNTRPLQGQSPYIVNAGIQYNDNNNGLNFSIAYNKVGRRITIVGNTQEPDMWENPRNVLDLQAGKTFFKRLDVKLNVRDLLAQDLIIYQDINLNKKYDENTDNTIVKSRFGATVSLNIGYKF